MLLTLRAGHTSTKTTTSSGTGDIGSVVTTVGQRHLCPRTLDTAHDYVVSADVSVPVPGFLGRRAEKGISHTLQCSEDRWRNIHPPCKLHSPSGKTNARANAITEADAAKGCWSRVTGGMSPSLFKQKAGTGIKPRLTMFPALTI